MGAAIDHYVLVDELSFQFHFAQDLAESDLLDLLQLTLRDTSPGLANGLRVLEYERDRSPMSVDPSDAGSLRRAVLDKGLRRGPTYQSLVADSPPTHERRFGYVLVRGEAPSTFLKVDFDEYTPARPSGDRWLFSNSIGGWIGTRRLDGLRRSDWVRQLAGALCPHPAFLWGAGFVRDEFRFRNLHSEEDGTWAVGRDIKSSLPGIFWLNAFGDPYLDLIGREVFARLDIESITTLGDNLAVVTYKRPEDWNSDEGRRAHTRVLDQLGRRFFFDRAIPEQDTVAPDFGLPPLTPKHPFRVMTTDGEHFTPIPGDDTGT